MDIRGKTICGQPAIRVRDALRVFDALPTQMDFSGDYPRVVPKRFTVAFLSETLDIATAQASVLLRCLISSGYINSGLIPTPRGMAIAHAVNRPRLPRKKALAILARFIAAVKAVNANPKARNFVQRVKLFGSLATSSPTVGDIDIQIIMPLPRDVCPEDLTERDRLVGQLRISRYLSFHDEMDYIADCSSGTVIYERKPPRRRRIGKRSIGRRGR
jgi:hypothetical protein